MDTDIGAFSLRDRALKLDTGADMEMHLPHSDNISSVTLIDISGNSLGLQAAERLGAALQHMRNLQTANLGDIFTARSDKEIPLALSALCDALGTLPALHSVDLSGNALGAYAPRLIPLFAAPALRTLNLENLGLSIESGTILANALAQSNSPGLRTFLGGRNRLEDGSAAAWGAAFAAHRTLSHVDLRRACFRSAGFADVVSGLKGCAGLRFLNLNENTGATSDGPEGWTVFFEALRGWTELRFLHVGDCILGPERFAKLLEVLKEGKHVQLKTLVLDYSDLDESVYAGLLEVVEEKLPALTVVSLAGNEDLEDNEAISRLRDVLQVRGGELIVDESDDGTDREWRISDYDDDDEVVAETTQTRSGEDDLAAQMAGLSVVS